LHIIRRLSSFFFDKKSLLFVVEFDKYVFMNTLEPADLIKKCLADAGISQRELSTLTRIGEVTLSRILNGHSAGSMKTLRRLQAFSTVHPPVAADQPPEAA